MTGARYGSYRDSGVEWLGEIPTHWELVPLKRVSQIRYGLGEPPSYLDSGVPLIRATNVHAGRLSPEGLVYVDPSDIPEKRIFWLKPGDIIVVRSGAYTGDSATIGASDCPCIAGFDMILRLEGQRADFIQYALLSPYLKNFQIDLERTRAAQPHLNAEELGSCLVVLPPPSEQAAIAAFLDRETAKIDALVEEQRRLIALLAEKRQAVISHAVTKGLDPTVPMKDSGVEWLGEVPAHWEVARLKNFMLSMEQGWSPQCEAEAAESDERWAVLKVGCVNGGVFDRSENKALPEDLSPRPDLALENGDLLISRANTRELVGSSAVVQVAEPRLMLCDKLYRIRLCSDEASADFVASYLSAAGARGQIALSATGASSSMLNIGQATIREMNVAMPPLSEQLHILAFIQTQNLRLADLELEAQAAITLLQERRAALISAAVTGKIDVRGLVPAVEEAA